MNKLTLDRWAQIEANVATLGIDLSSISAEPNVKFKGNHHVTRVKSQFINCSSLGMENQMDREEKLVETIMLREHTCLWKVNATERKDATAKENA